MNRPISNENKIGMYLHCAMCLSELPPEESPKSYTRYEVGYTKQGIQVWCNRHNCNIIHIDFEGAKHPANTTRKKGE